MLKGDTDTDTDTLISEISIPIPIPILFKYRISILIRYRYDTFGQKYRNFDTDTIVSKVSDVNWGNLPAVGHFVDLSCRSREILGLGSCRHFSWRERLRMNQSQLMLGWPDCSLCWPPAPLARAFELFELSCVGHDESQVACRALLERGRPQSRDLCPQTPRGNGRNVLDIWILSTQ